MKLVSIRWATVVIIFCALFAGALFHCIASKPDRHSNAVLVMAYHNN
ncbi:MAG: hypothetical protein IKD21_02300 [Clostridia bacterium]|nr:hypothetical protein [Clostridia bacterium]